jgi:pimeloyl-ACP methyl ester carboxylesterase
MARAILNGTAVNFRQAGDGTDVVLIHGLGANHAFWRLDVLLPLARCFRVTTYDLKGHGYSEASPSGYTTRHLSDDLTALLDHLSIPRAYLVGHSYGGLVALHTAALHPERVLGVAVIDSRVRALQPGLRLDGWPDFDALQSLMRDLGIDIPADTTDAGIDALDHLADPLIRQRLQEAARLRAFEGYIPFAGLGGGGRSAERWLQLVRGTSAPAEFRDQSALDRATLGLIAAPVLALYGGDSHCLESGRGLRDLLPDCRLVTVPDAGHYFPVTRAGDMVAALEAFLAEPAAAGPVAARRA